MADNKVKFLRGTADEYANAVKDNDTFYYTVDDGKFYLGNQEITGGINEHLTEQLNSEEGVHGLRYYNEGLQFNNGETWVTIETDSGKGGLVPGDMKSVSAEVGAEDNTILLKGSDPDDITSDGNVICKWLGTKIVRKVGSYPTKVSDGVLVVDYQTRDQYANAAFVDRGLATGETYYYRWFPYSDQGIINNSEDEAVNRTTCTAVKFSCVGVIADWENNTYTRINDAVGLNAGSDFDQFKMFGQRRRCIVANDGTILAFYGDEAYTETGKLTQAVTINGTTYNKDSDCQVMVYQPKFYYKVTPLSMEKDKASKWSSEGTGYILRKAAYQVSEIQYPGFKLHPCFKRIYQWSENLGGGQSKTHYNEYEIPYVLFAAYEGSWQRYTAGGLYQGTYITDGTVNTSDSYNLLSSVAGVKPTCKYRLSDYRRGEMFYMAKIRNTTPSGKGYGYAGVQWRISDLFSISCTQLLFLIEYATMDAQTAIGKGYVEYSGSFTDQQINTGGTSSLGNTSGRDISKDDGLGSVSYRGEENLWGNLPTWVGSCLLYDYKNSSNPDNSYSNIYLNLNPYLIQDIDSDKLSTLTGYSGTYSESTEFSFAKSSGYVSAFGYSTAYDFMFIPCETLGDSANPVGDNFNSYHQYVSDNSQKYAMPVFGFGYSSNSSLQNGLFGYSFSVISTTDGSDSIGVRLLCLPPVGTVVEEE